MTQTGPALKPAAILFACAMAMSGIASAQNQPAPPDTPGGVATTHVIVKLRPDSFTRGGYRRAAAQADGDALPRAGVRLRNMANAWRARKMRRNYEPPFRNPELAARHGLDRTFVIEVPAGTDTQRFADALRSLGDEIESVSTDGVGGVGGVPTLIPPDSQFNTQWAMHNTGQMIQGVFGTSDADIDAPEAWAIHTGDWGTVTVAIVDSGVSSHPEFGNNLGPNSTGRILPGFNTVTNSSASASLQDNCPHGTHVAGTVAAAGGKRCGGFTTEAGFECESAADCTRACAGGANNGLPCLDDGDCPSGECGNPTCNADGVVGVTWGANLLPVKILTGCTGNSTDLAEGIIWAVDHGADIINLSLQYKLNPNTQQTAIDALQAAIDYAHSEGALLIAATGNNDFCTVSGSPSPPNDVVCYPARLNHVMAVTATDNNDVLGSFSNYGPEVDVSAPGKDIRSTYTNGSYQFLYGTSMAAPHVSGLAALIKSYVPSLTNDEIESLIIATTEDLGEPGWDNQFGHGRINAYNAMVAAPHWPGILDSVPPDGAIDAGQPIDRKSLTPLGWSNIDIRFPRDPATVASGDFTIEQNVAGTAPSIVAIMPLENNWVRVVLSHPINPGAWTTLTHVSTGTRVRLGYLPGDVSGDSFTSPADILSLIDSLNGIFLRPIWSTDVDRSGQALPADILTLIDLLNGVAPFTSYNGASLPDMP